MAQDGRHPRQESEHPLVRLGRRSVLLFARFFTASLSVHKGARDGSDRLNSSRYRHMLTDYDINMPGMVENHWRAAAWSPSGISHLGGSVSGPFPADGKRGLTARSSSVGTNGRT